MRRMRGRRAFCPRTSKTSRRRLPLPPLPRLTGRGLQQQQQHQGGRRMRPLNLMHTWPGK
jgi:hypothetical protein